MNITDTNITINVKDLDRSIAFYENLGLIMKIRWNDHYAQLTAPGITIGLHPSQESGRAANSGNVSIGFTTEDFAQAKDDLERAGIEVQERTEEGGEFLHFKDPDGTSLYFIKPKWG